MTLESRLRETFEHESEHAEIPPVDITSIVVGGAARARRRRGTTIGVAAAAVLAVVASMLAVTGALRLDALSGPASEDQSVGTVRELPTGERPRLPHCLRGEGTVVDGRTVWSGCGTMVSRGGTTLVMNADGTNLLTEEGLVLLGHDEGGWYPAVSHDGDVVAFLTKASDGRQRLVVVDVSDPSSVRRLADQPVDTSSAWVPGIDDQRRVYVWAFDAISRLWVYDVDEAELSRVTGLPDTVQRPGTSGVRYVTSDGVALRSSAFVESGETADVSVEGVVDGSGRFVSAAERPIGMSHWSPDRRRLVHETAAGWWIQPEDLSGRVELRLPAQGRAVALPVWESDEAVLVPFDPDGDPSEVAVTDPEYAGDVRTRDLYVLRCSADDGSCETALPPGQAPGGLRGPLYR